MAKVECVTLFPEVETVTRKLSDEQFGILMRAVIAYRFRGEVYDGEDAALDIAFQFLSNQVDRAEAIKKEMSNLSRKRWDKQSDAVAPEMNAAASKMDAPIQSNPIQSVPIQSDPVQSNPNTQKEIYNSANVKSVRGAAAPASAGKRSYGKFGWVKLSQQEYDALERLLGERELKRCIDYLDQSAQSTGNKNRWRDFGLVIRRCAEEGWGLRRYGEKEEIPKGASGVLGEAEMESIRRILQKETETLQRDCS